MKQNVVFNIEQKTDTHAVIAVNGVIGDEYDGNDAKSFANQLMAMKGVDLTIKINSPGGYITDGMQIHDLLAMHDGQVTTEIYGASASAATVISQAGNRRMSSNALMLVHHAWGMALGNRYDYEEQIKTLDKFDERILSIYVKRGANEEVIKDLMAVNGGHGEWIDAEQALSYGLIDEIFEPAEVKAQIDKDLIKNMGLPELPQVKEANPTGVQDSTQVDAEAQSERRRRLITIKQNED